VHAVTLIKRTTCLLSFLPSCPQKSSGWTRVAGEGLLSGVVYDAGALKPRKTESSSPPPSPGGSRSPPSPSGGGDGPPSPDGGGGGGSAPAPQSSSGALAWLPGAAFAAALLPLLVLLL
jgi:hypothetical protein